MLDKFKELARFNREVPYQSDPIGMTDNRISIVANIHELYVMRDQAPREAVDYLEEEHKYFLSIKGDKSRTNDELE